MKNILVFMGLFAAIIVFNVWGDIRERDIRSAAVAYERCVQSEYHMTPTAWYEQTGQYPLCGN